MLGIAKKAETEMRPNHTALGVLDRMGYNLGAKGVAAFRKLPMLDQHTILMKAWKEKGNLWKAREHALVLYDAKMQGRRSERDCEGALEIAVEFGRKDEDEIGGLRPL